MGRRVLGVLVLAALLVGCGAGGGTGLEKVTYPRTVIPAAAADPSRVDRLSAEGLRLVDPCDLLDVTVLAKFGPPDDNVAQDYGSCRNYMKDTAGESLSFTIRVGESILSRTLERATEQIGGFKAEQNTVEGACFLTLIVEEPEPDLGVELQVGLDKGDPCVPAREVIAGAAQRLRTTATLRTPDRGSLLPLDPCTFVGDLPAKALPGADEADPFGLHQCTWRTGGSEIELRFGHRFDPGSSTASDRGEPVDVGGVTAFQRRRADVFPACELEWMHRKFGDDGRGDVVSVNVRDIDKKGLDVCGIAASFAKSLVAKLPKP